MQLLDGLDVEEDARLEASLGLFEGGLQRRPPVRPFRLPAGQRPLPEVVADLAHRGIDQGRPVIQDVVDETPVNLVLGAAVGLRGWSAGQRLVSIFKRMSSSTRARSRS